MGRFFTRSWTCVFFGHRWVPVYKKETVRGYGDRYVEMYAVCNRCNANR